MNREHATPNPLTGFQHAHRKTSAAQLAGRRQSCHSRSNNDYIRISCHSRLLFQNG